MSAKRKTPTKPEPVAVTTVCSECGLNWDLHGPDPTTDDCIRLLKSELESARAFRPCPQPIPFIPYKPWPSTYPYTEPWRPAYPGELPKIWCGTNEARTKDSTLISYNTPEKSNSSICSVTL